MLLLCFVSVCATYNLFYEILRVHIAIVVTLFLFLRCLWLGRRCLHFLVASAGQCATADRCIAYARSLYLLIILLRAFLLSFVFVVVIDVVFGLAVANVFLTQ